LRALPGGKFGFPLMVLIFTLSKITDLVTTARVQPVQVQSRCPFGQGLMFNLTEDQYEFPDANSRVTLWASNAQWNSVTNNYSNSETPCQIGIYAKVNTDTNFCADDLDVLGRWDCSFGDTVTFPHGTANTVIANELVGQGLIYNQKSSQWLNLYPMNQCSNPSLFNQLSIWSSSAPSDTAHVVWDVKAAFQSNWGDSCDDVVMIPAHCTMEAPYAETVQKAIYSVSALSNWTSYLQGLMYEGNFSPLITEAETTLEIILNSMITVQGGGNFVQWTYDSFFSSTYSNNGPNPSRDQGCIITATIIPPEVEFLIVFTALVLSAIFITFLVYHLRYLRHAQDNKSAAQQVPNDVLSWAALAAKEHQNR
jgi:hypothetical protein